MKFVPAISAVCLLFSLAFARADEVTLPLAQGGEWVAFAHKPSAIAAPDVCMAAAPKTGLALRMDGDTFEIRFVDMKWSLPANIDGLVALVAEPFRESYKVSSNTSNMISAEMPLPDAIRLLDAMIKGTNMSITVGKTKPVAISLLNSSRAIRAFRTCSNIGGDASGNDQAAPGSNPFK